MTWAGRLKRVFGIDVESCVRCGRAVKVIASIEEPTLIEQILALKLKEAGLDDQVPVKVMPVGSKFKLGPFGLEMVSVTHSIPEPTALLIETDQGRVLHSGDWKIDRTPVLGQGMDEKRLREIGAKGTAARFARAGKGEFASTKKGGA